MAKILLVEDDEAIAEGLKFSFEQTDHEFLTAATIKEAKAVADSEGLSLILLDVSLSDGNGFDFYRNIIKDIQNPAIFLTAKDDENDIVKGLELGAEDYITKPFSIKDQLARVNRVLLRQRKTQIYQSEDIVFDMDKMEVKKAGNAIVLSA